MYIYTFKVLKYLLGYFIKYFKVLKYLIIQIYNTKTLIKQKTVPFYKV